VQHKNIGKTHFPTESSATFAIIFVIVRATSNRGELLSF